jgi:hypothetical protein
MIPWLPVAASRLLWFRIRECIRKWFLLAVLLLPWSLQLLLLPPPPPPPPPPLLLLLLPLLCGVSAVSQCCYLLLVSGVMLHNKQPATTVPISTGMVHEVIGAALNKICSICCAARGRSAAAATLETIICRNQPRMDQLMDHSSLSDEGLSGKSLISPPSSIDTAGCADLV